MVFRIVYDPRNLAATDLSIITPAYAKSAASASTSHAAMLSAMEPTTRRITNIYVKIPGTGTSYEIAADSTIVEIDGQYFALPNMDKVKVIPGGEKDVTLDAVNLSTGEPVALGRFIDKDDFVEYDDRHPLVIAKDYAGKFDKSSQSALEAAELEIQGNLILGREASAFILNNHLYFIMPKLPGSDLMSCYESDLISNIKFDDRLAAINALAEQVNSMHHKGYLLVDLSPENVMLADSTLNLFDFGSAKKADKLRIGSADKDLYLDEDSLANGTRDKSSDLFALSVVIGMLFPEVFKLSVEMDDASGKQVAHVMFRDDLPADHEYRDNPLFNAIIALNDVKRKDQWSDCFKVLLASTVPSVETIISSDSSRSFTTPTLSDETSTAAASAAASEMFFSPISLASPTSASATKEIAILNLNSVKTPEPPKKSVAMGPAGLSLRLGGGKPPILRLSLGGAAADSSTEKTPSGRPPMLHFGGAAGGSPTEEAPTSGRPPMLRLGPAHGGGK